MAERIFTPEELEAIRLENEKIAAELAAIPEVERANRQSKARFDYINQQLNSYEQRKHEHRMEVQWRIEREGLDPAEVVSVLEATDPYGIATGHYLPEWQPGVIYAPGTQVKHKGRIYEKANDGDNSPPDDVPGGWVAA
jgi:hypothetical protein